jgi:hypothetical protein
LIVPVEFAEAGLVPVAFIACIRNRTRPVVGKVIVYDVEVPATSMVVVDTIVTVPPAPTVNRSPITR